MFVSSALLSQRRAFEGTRASCRAKPASSGLRMVGYQMDGSGLGSLTPLHYKASAVTGDRRCFRVSYVLPNESRPYSGRPLDNIAQTKMVPFVDWYAEQQRIMKMGGKITKVELISGGQQRNCGNV